jgi:hypothetical protein
MLGFSDSPKRSGDLWRLVKQNKTILISEIPKAPEGRNINSNTLSITIKPQRGDIFLRAYLKYFTSGPL